MCECSMHTSDPPGAMALQMPLLPHFCVRKWRLLRACTTYTWDANTPFCVRKLHVLRVSYLFERARKNTLLRAQKALFAPVTKVG